ncbi:MAG TPA: hypothetical protein VLF79_00020 [Candidatus Saccharimonadales bacterium]|nr:hypothetical protein [Candidatus Saccharimonadales bacterium]
MNPGRSPLEQGPSFYYAPPNDGGRIGDFYSRIFARDVSVKEEPLDPYDQIDHISDSERATVMAEEFLFGLYTEDRYGLHIDRVLRYHDRYISRDGFGEDDQVAIEVERSSIALHDLVDHAVLNPAKVADRIGREPDDATEIKEDGLNCFNKILNQVDDQESLIQAFMFAIDASKWEKAARIWRTGANNRIDQLEADGELHPYTSKILRAAINKDPEILSAIYPEELTRVLKENVNVFLDLKLEAISETAINHNVEGLYLKALETLDIIEHPPEDNPASTWRDCIEAINFFVPALATLGYKQLAMDLRGAALMWLIDDPNGNAKRQHELAVKHFGEVNNAVNEIVEYYLDNDFNVDELIVEQRIKTEGSTRAKLAESKYVDCKQIPDGIGFAFVMFDTMDYRTMEKFAQNYMNRLLSANFNIVARHPKGDAAFDPVRRSAEDGGYQAIHMTFYYFPENGSGEGVPFEIQVLTQAQQKLKLYGPSTDLFYKYEAKNVLSHQFSARYTDLDQPHLDHLGRRGDAEREMAPGSTVQSISEVISQTPELRPFVFNKLYRSIDFSGNRRILIPRELEDLAFDLTDELVEIFKQEEGLIVLPTSKLSLSQFNESIGLFSRDLTRNENVINALQLVGQSEAGQAFREDGITTAIEGHILPTALSALMLAIQSGKIWESDNVKPSEYMANIVTVAVLHDYVEGELDKHKGDFKALRQVRHAVLTKLGRQYGSEIMKGVDALTLPLEIADEHLRREQYRRNVQSNGYARIIKPADRWQNHITDMVKLVNNNYSHESDSYKQIMKYFSKSDNYPFLDPELSAIYKRVHDTIWLFAKNFGHSNW